MWVFMFLFFLVSLLLFMIVNYFVTPYSKIKDIELKIVKNEKDWKW